MTDVLRRALGDACLAVLGDAPPLSHRVYVVALTPDGAAAWCIGHDTATLLSVSDLRVLARSDAPRGQPLAARATGPDASACVVLDAGGRVYSLDGVERGAIALSVGEGSFSRDGALLATAPGAGVRERVVTVWSLRPLRRVRSFVGDAPLSMRGDGALVAHGVAGWKGLGLGFTRVDDGVCVRRSLPRAVSLASLGDDDAAWCLVGDDQRARCPMDPAARIESVAVRGETRLIQATPAGVVCAAREGRRVTLSRGDATVATLALSAGFVAAVSEDGARLVGVDGFAPYAVDLDDGAVRWGTTGHDEARDLAWSHDGARLATVATDGTARVWDAATGEALQRLEGMAPGDGVAVAWGRDGRTLYLRGGDGAVAQWDLVDEMPRRRWALGPVRVLASGRVAPRARSRLAVSPDDTRLAVTDVGLWVLDLGADAPAVSRAEISQAAWHEDHPAVLVTLSRALAGRDVPWEVEDHHGLRRMAHGSLPTLHGAQLSSDGRSVGARGRGEVVRLHTITPDGPGAPVERLGGGALASVVALRGERLVTVALPEGSPLGLRLRVSDGRGTFEAPPFVGAARIDDARVSPDETRLAAIVGGRVAVLALPGP